MFALDAGMAAFIIIDLQKAILSPEPVLRRCAKR